MIQDIKTHRELSEFIVTLRQNYIDSPQSWENDNLAAYLDAMAAWTADCEGCFKNNNLPLPDPEVWRIMGMMLSAARIYE